MGYHRLDSPGMDHSVLATGVSIVVVNQLGYRKKVLVLTHACSSSSSGGRIRTRPGSAVIIDPDCSSLPSLDPLPNPQPIQHHDQHS